jgi:putative membrane protein
MIGSLLRVGFVIAILAAAWIVRSGFGDVSGALSRAGWGGMAAMTAYHLLPVALCGLAWRILLPGGSLRLFIALRWIRDGIGDLAGFLPLSGEMASARLLNRLGVSGGMAGALTVVDITAEVLSQILFSLIGVAIWMRHHPSSDVVRWAFIGTLAAMPVMLAFVVVQRSALVRLLETLPHRLLPKIWAAPAIDSGLHAAIHAVYADRMRVACAVAVHLAAWITSAGEAALALWLLGHPLPLTDVLALESVIFALRSAAFVVPAAIGVQEGGYVLIGAALGLPPEVALSISLLKRGRELILGLPALLAWHILGTRNGAAALIPESATSARQCDASSMPPPETAQPPAWPSDELHHDRCDDRGSPPQG